MRKPRKIISIEEKLKISHEDKLLPMKEIDKQLALAKYELDIAREDDDYLACVKAYAKLEKYSYLKKECENDRA